MLLLVSAVTLAGGAETLRGQSAIDGFDPNVNGTVKVVVVQPDGKILLGGDFTSLSPNGGAMITRNHLARLNSDGTLDTAFAPNGDSSPFSSVEAMAVQADGKILVGGSFTSIGGQTRNGLARLDPMTGLADSFDPNANNDVLSIAVQGDGKILVAGIFTSIGGQTRNRIARLDATTGLADSFDPNAWYQPGQPDGIVGSIQVQTDGKILVGGLFTNVGGQTRNNIARLDAVTGLADSFDPNATGSVASIALQADGKILLGGDFTQIGGQTRNHIARLDATTGLADSFDPNASVPGQYVSGVYAIAVQANGKVLVGGLFTNVGGQTRNNIARLNPITGLADSFDPNPNDIVVSIAAQADGKILAGGLFNSIGTEPRNGIARLETEGRLDQTLNPSLPLSSEFLATAVQPDGKILIGGNFTTVLGVARNNIARLNADGTLDMAFNPNANSTVFSIAVQTDGKILVGGVFNGVNSIGGQSRSHIARLDATTGLADSFNPNAYNDVTSILLQGDGKILVGGSFNRIGGEYRNYIARLDPTTGLADSFNPFASNEVSSIAVQTDGKILVGGLFTDIGGHNRNYIARLDPTTGSADSFNPNANNQVGSIAVQTDGKILAGGVFTRIGGQARNYMARLDPTTGLVDSFNANANGVVVGPIVLQADGKILVGGAFTSIGGQARYDMARLDPTTGLVDSFNANANGVVEAIVLQADGKILAGGVFTSIGGQTRSHFARLSNDTAPMQDLIVTQDTIVWTRGGSSPQFTRVTFEFSSDNVNYTPLGNGTASGSNFTLTGLRFATGENLYIRARGYYQYNGSESITESSQNVFFAGPPPTTLLNISTRTHVLTGDQVLIGGFIITGTSLKKVIIRGMGPSLNVNGTPIPGRLADPTLELHQPDGTVITNDNWKIDDKTGQSQEAAIRATTIPPTNDLESALVATLAPGNYTAILAGKNGGTGVGLVEVYDLAQGANSTLANISSRGFVDTNDNVMIGGLIVGGGSGGGTAKVIVRAIGPSLSVNGTPVPGRLADPTLELHNSNGSMIVTNDNWKINDQTGQSQEADIRATTIPPTNDLESALVATLPPGNYTAIVRGKNNTTGVAVVEVYNLQ
jgi:uncharacterized delta-60 repeat protein